MNKQCLFVYATLMDAKIRQIVFGEEVRALPATLKGWQVTRSSDAYFNLSPADGAICEGRLLFLSPGQFRIADAFEDVPLYRCERVMVLTADNALHEAFVYIRANETGAPADGKDLSSLTRSELIEVARSFRKEWENENALAK